MLRCTFGGVNDQAISCGSEGIIKSNQRWKHFDLAQKYSLATKNNKKSQSNR